MKRRSPPLTDESTLSHQIVGAVANAMGTDPVDCPPLYEAINPSALDRLFEGKQSHGSIAFEYGEYVITVDNKENVTLTESSS